MQYAPHWLLQCPLNLIVYLPVGQPCNTVSRCACGVRYSCIGGHNCTVKAYWYLAYSVLFVASFALFVCLASARSCFATKRTLDKRFELYKDVRY